MKFSKVLLLFVGVFLIAVNGQPCRPDGSFCTSTRDCCMGLECSFRDSRCLRPFACRTWGQYCTFDFNCCGHLNLRCHPLQQKCVRSDEICQQFGQPCGFERCCLGLRCNNGRCVN